MPRKLRRWLEEQALPYVLAVKNNEPLWADTEDGSAQVRPVNWPSRYPMTGGNA